MARPGWRTSPQLGGLVDGHDAGFHRRRVGHQIGGDGVGAGALHALGA